MAKTMNPKDLAEFSETLAILLEAGLPLDQALLTAQEVLEAPAGRALAGRLLELVRQGHSLSWALKQAQGGLSPAYLGLVRVGEGGGALGQVLGQLAANLRRNQELKRSVSQALYYPAVLILFSLGAVGFILAYVLPTFVAAFRQSNLALPPMAAMLVDMGDFLARHGLTLILALVLAVLLFLWAWRHPRTQAGLSRALLSLGPLGRLLSWWQTVLFCRGLEVMLAAGMPLDLACQLAAGAVTNPGFARALAPVHKMLSQGQSLLTALTACKVIPTAGLRLVALGEQTGQLAAMCGRTADLLEARVRFITSRLLALAEPIIILAMGLMVGLVVVTMLSTIFTLSQGGQS